MKASRTVALALGAALAGVSLTACGLGSDDALTVGTTEAVVSIDPAGPRDPGSLTVQTQVYQHLMSPPPGSTRLAPDAAESCEFTRPTVYTCTLKEGLTFANGNELAASDVVHSINRVLEIDAPGGPAALLSGLEKVEATDKTTVAFTLATADDQSFPAVLVSPAGAIVDEETHPAGTLLGNADAVKAAGFSGPYTIGAHGDDATEFTANPDYDGAQGTPRTGKVTLRHFDEPADLAQAVEKGDVDIAWRSLLPADVDELDRSGSTRVHTAPGGDIRYLAFNLKTMPGDPWPRQLALRRAIATSIDREEIAREVYHGTYAPAWSFIPPGQLGATEMFKDYYGDGPDRRAAEKHLAEAGMTAPVSITLHYAADLYGEQSKAEYELIKSQLEATRLFTVTLKAVKGEAYETKRVEEDFPFQQWQWSPEYPDVDSFLTRTFAKGNVLKVHYENADTTAVIDQQRTTVDRAERVAVLKSLQDRLAWQVLVLPLLVSEQVAVAQPGVDGVADTLDASLLFRFSTLSK